MTPKEKAMVLVYKYEHYLYNTYTTDEDWVKCVECALIAVDEILETTKVKWATQRKFPNGEYKFWKGVAYKKYWQEVKQEIEKL